MQKTVVVQQTQYIAVCHGKTNSLNLECSETVEDDLQNAVQRWSGRCSCRDALISTTFVSPLIYCNIFSNKILSTFFTFTLHIWKKISCFTFLFGRKPRSISSHLHSLLFALIFLYHLFWRKFHSRFLAFSLHVQTKNPNVLLFSFEHVFP